MPNDNTTTKPSTAKPGWREEFAYDPNEKTIVEVANELIADVPDEEFDDLPPNTPEGVARAAIEK